MFCGTPTQNLSGYNSAIKKEPTASYDHSNIWIYGTSFTKTCPEIDL